MAKTKPQGVRVLSPSEYPASITATRGAFTPDIRWAAEHPLGLYYVCHQGAGHMAAVFVPKRKGSREKQVGAGRTVSQALQRIAEHEDELVNPDAPRHDGRNGPVDIFALGRRSGGTKTPTELDREIAAYMALHKDS